MFAYRLLLDLILKLLRAALGRSLAATMDAGRDKASREAVRNVLLNLMFEKITESRRAAWAASVLFLDSEGKRNGVDAYLPPLPQYTRQAFDQEAERVDPFSPEGMAKLCRIAERHTEMAARRTIVDATGVDSAATTREAESQADGAGREQAERLERLQQATEEIQRQSIQPNKDAERRKAFDQAKRDAAKRRKPRRPTRPFAWARVVNPTSEKPPCGFCFVLSARGPVYASRETAGQNEAGDPNRYHSNCRCIAVPVYTSKDWPGKEAYKEAKALYEKRSKEGFEFEGSTNIISDLDRSLRGARSDEKSKRRKERQAQRIAVAEKVVHRESGRGKPNLTDRELLEYAARAKALKSNLRGETLYAHEIELVERMESHGHLVEWIPKAETDKDGTTPPTNDFLWLTRDGVPTEAKAVDSNKYSRIKGRIRKAVTSAQQHGVVKDVFVIDLGPRYLPQKLRRQLQRHNQNTDAFPIKELWVMFDDGRQFEQIELK